MTYPSDPIFDGTNPHAMADDREIEQPIEQLLDEVDAACNAIRRDVHTDNQLIGFASTATRYLLRLSRELRRRIEREQELRSLVYIGDHEFPDLTWKARCLEANADLNTCREKVRQQLEQQQQSEVEAAFIELREMFPDTVRRIEQWTRMDSNLVHHTIDIGSGGITNRLLFDGYSLSEALQKVRQWKESQQ